MGVRLEPASDWSDYDELRLSRWQRRATILVRFAST